MENNENNFLAGLSPLLKQAHPARCWNVVDSELQRV